MAAYPSCDTSMLMPTITICTFLTLTNGFKLFDQNLALTGGNPGKTVTASRIKYLRHYVWNNRLAGCRSGKGRNFLLYL